VLESCFGKFKTLEREQSKGGFTSLLLALAACVSERTHEVVHKALQTSKTADVIGWFKTKKLSQNPTGCPENKGEDRVLR